MFLEDRQARSSHPVQTGGPGGVSPPWTSPYKPARRKLSDALAGTSCPFYPLRPRSLFPCPAPLPAQASSVHILLFCTSPHLGMTCCELAELCAHGAVPSATPGAQPMLWTSCGSQEVVLRGAWKVSRELIIDLFLGSRLRVSLLCHSTGPQNLIILKTEES